MIRFYVAAAVTACAFSINAAAALAAGSDPTKIGDNAKDVVWPNAKAFWWIFLLLGVLRVVATRKRSEAGGVFIALLVAGIVIYNPAGVGSSMQGLADKIV